jgi:hypothetical protein
VFEGYQTRRAKQESGDNSENGSGTSVFGFPEEQSVAMSIRADLMHDVRACPGAREPGIPEELPNTRKELWRQF